MEELYYFNERSTALKIVRSSEVCEEKIIPLADDEIHNKYDKGYKYLFSVKKNFIEFVKTFMKVELNVELTEENITLVDKEFITKEFDKQESDIIYEVRDKNKVVYFVLLELQQSILATQLCFVGIVALVLLSKSKIWTELKA